MAPEPLNSVSISSIQMVPKRPPFEWKSIAIFPGEKQTEREAGCSLPFRREFKYNWSYVHTPSHDFVVRWDTFICSFITNVLSSLLQYSASDVSWDITAS
jgi:hypothetical protein